jgi:hypothetical protein
MQGGFFRKLSDNGSAPTCPENYKAELRLSEDPQIQRVAATEVPGQSSRNVSSRERPPREQPEHHGQDGSEKKQVRISWQQKSGIQPFSP